MTDLYGEQWGLVMLLSFLFTWSIGLLPPLLIRFAFTRRPIGKGWAIGTVAMLWAFNVVLFTALGSQSKTHGALVLVAFVSYAILRKGAKNKTTPATPVDYEPVLPENSRTITTPTFCDDEDVYDKIARELETGVANKGLWTRLFAEYEGDERQTKVAYIKQRAKRLIAAKHAVMEQTPQEYSTNTDQLNKQRAEGASSKKNYWSTDKCQSSTTTYDKFSEELKRIERRTLTRIHAIYPSASNSDSNKKDNK